MSVLTDGTLLYKGLKVSYKKFDDTFEKGIIKEIPDWTTEQVRVVYNCGGEWADYENYTSALTRIEDLVEGWDVELDPQALKEKECGDHYYIERGKWQSGMICQDCGKIIE